MLNGILDIIFKRIRDIFIGILCLGVGIYMVVTNKYSEIAIIIISVVAFVYTIFGEKLNN